MPPILFRDTRFVVLDKPAGLKVHAGPGGGDSVETVFPALSRRRDGPWLVHRLDADTAGCLVIALRRAALLAAQAEFAAGRARKTYWAVVRGVPPATEGVVDAPLLRRTTPAGWRMVVDPAGQSAVTGWRVRGVAGDIAWLSCIPGPGAHIRSGRIALPSGIRFSGTRSMAAAPVACISWRERWFSPSTRPSRRPPRCPATCALRSPAAAGRRMADRPLANMQISLYTAADPHQERSDG